MGAVEGRSEAPVRRRAGGGEGWPTRAHALGRAILMSMFARPRGVLGRLGGRIMARTNAACGVWVCGLLRVAAHDEVLEVGFGPGATIAHLSALAHSGRVVGIDASSEMVEQARKRNIAAISSGRVDLRLACVDHLPLGDNSFDKALAINSMQAWPDAVAGLREIRRVLKPGASIALGFTPYSGQAKEELPGLLLAAGFTRPSLLEEKGRNFCVLAAKPDPA